MQKEITIIGGGIIGLACAYYLISDGHRVRVIDQKSIGDSCALGNAGYISPSHFIPLSAPGMVKKGLKWMFDSESPFYIHPRFDWSLFSWLWQFNRFCSAGHVATVKQVLFDLCMRSRELYLSLAEDLSNSIELKQNGIYVLCHSQKALDEEMEILTQARALGLNASEVSQTALVKEFPDMEFDITGGVLFPEDGHVHPQKLLESLYGHLQHQGVEFIENCAIDLLQSNGERIIAIGSQDQQFPVDELVVASGSWTPQLGRQLKLNIPVQAGKGYSVTIDKPWSVDTPMILSEGAVAVTPFDDHIRFGGTMEFAGVDLSIDQRRVTGILKSVKQFIPNFNPEWVDRKKAWAGLRPCSPDGLPLIGRVEGYRNLTLATGHAMLGLTLAPVTGKIVADIVSGAVPPNHAFIDPQRFH